MVPYGGYFIDLVNQQMNCLFQDLSGQDLVKNMTPVIVVRCLGDDWVMFESNGERAAIQPLHEEIQQWLHKEALETAPTSIPHGTSHGPTTFRLGRPSVGYAPIVIYRRPFLRSTLPQPSASKW